MTESLSHSQSLRKITRCQNYLKFCAQKLVPLDPIAIRFLPSVIHVHCTSHAIHMLNVSLNRPTDIIGNKIGIHFSSLNQVL